MNIVKKQGITFLEFDIYSKHSNLIAVHSTRLGGVSKGHHSQMNLGFARGDDPEAVHKNYELFTSTLGIDKKRLVLSDQWHHNAILKVDESHLGMGIFRERNYSDIDGLVTDKPGIPLVTFYADCTPIYFYDDDKKIIGMCHAGWRGTASAIVRDMVNVFVNDYGCSLSSIKVGIGPSICKACYQVTEEVTNAMKFSFDVSKYYDYVKEEDRYYIDLKAINKALLIEEGIKEANIEVSQLCTKCRVDLFHSHRRQGNDRGTQIGLMMLEEK
jgi:YfiH family protein